MVKSNITEIFGLSRSMVSMASSIKAYEESLKKLMDSFIQLLAVAIDQKSPYTGEHCARVPVLARTLSARQKEIEEDFAFIAGCNVGGEFMDGTQADRVKKIAKETWERRLDADLFKLSLESGVYMKYAEEFLAPEQIDEIRIEDYIKTSPDEGKQKKGVGSESPQKGGLRKIYS
ncbi:hypothetical protein [uncultured Desulfobacter sp.]|uniref:hypothetical protein n=1 Tax=uncultured Desulfobacter sp. TaxID=240139 RepID=UPI0029F500D0|nr:hypothetical protein [uncultured Desulfobacter sp.]